MAHDITDERDERWYRFCQGVSGLHGDQLAVFLSQFGSDDDALLADFQRSLGSAEPCEAVTAVRCADALLSSGNTCKGMRSELCRGGGHKLFGMIWEHILGLADVIGIAVLNDQIIIDDGKE